MKRMSIIKINQEKTINKIIPILNNKKKKIVFKVKKKARLKKRKRFLLMNNIFLSHLFLD